MADRKTIGKVVNNKQNPENFDVSYHIHEGIGDPVIYNDKDEWLYNLTTVENVPIEKVFLGEEYPIENIVIHFGAFAEVEIDTLVIPEGVTDIPEYCFFTARIKTLKLPSTLETIGILDPSREFRSSKDLRNLSNAFAKAEIGTLVIPEGVKSIPVECFKEAKIKKLILPSTLETISAGAFAEVEIDTLVIPEDVTEIPMGFFYEAKIKTLKLPSELSTFGIGDFEHENSSMAFAEVEIDTLEIPEGVTEIPAYCFAGAKIKTLTLPNTLETISAGAFAESVGAFAEVEIDSLYIKNVSSIGQEAFKGFQGTIFTDNKESKAKFVKAGLDAKQVVDLSSREECFKALKNKTFKEIRQLESDFGREIWDKDYLNTIEQGVIIKDKKLPIDLKYIDMTLSDAAKLKEEILDASKKQITNKLGMFNSPLDNENNDPEETNKNNPSKGKS